MEQLILIVHVLIALGIVGLILIQQGKGADMGASFGAGASNTLFGSTGGGNALTRATAILATLFFATSFGLAVVAKNKAMLSDDVDIPVPAVIESKDIPSSPVTEDEIPAVDLSTQEAVDGMDGMDSLEVPSNEVAPESIDIPTDDSVPVNLGSDIPE